MFLSYSSSFAVFIASSSFLFGYAISVLNTIEKHLTVLLSWCPDAVIVTDPNGVATQHLAASCVLSRSRIGVVQTLGFLFAAVGSLSGGHVVSYGRRTALALVHVTFVVGGIVCGVATHHVALYIGRSLVGLAVGFTTVVAPLYIAEMSPVAVRGKNGALHQVLITFGILVGVALGLGAGTIPEQMDPTFVLSRFQRFYVRGMLAFPGIISLVCLVAFMLFREDSPTYYVGEEFAGRAVRVLQKIYNKDDVEDEMRQLVIENEENRMMKESSRMSMNQIMAKYGWVLVVGSVLSIGQQLSGINAFVALSSTVFEKAGLPAEYTSRASTAMAVANFLMAFPPMLLVERLGRRTLLLTTVFFQTLSLAIFPIVSWIPNVDPDLISYVAVAAVLCFIVCFSMGYGPVLWLYLPEMFPPEIRGVGAGIASALNWLACVSVIAFASFVDSAMVKFTVFTVSSALSFVWIFMFMRETKGLPYSPFFPKSQQQSMMPGGAMRNEISAFKSPRTQI